MENTFRRGDPCLALKLLGRQPKLVLGDGNTRCLREVAEQGASQLVAQTGEPQIVVVADSDPADQLCDVLGVLLAGGVAYPLSNRYDAVAEAQAVGASAVLAGGRVIYAQDPRAELPEGAALILRTSGSSGAVRRVVLGAEGVLANVRAIAGYLPVAAHPRTGIVLPFSYSYALVGQAFVTMWTGGSVVTLHSPYPAVQVERARRLEVSGLSSVAGSLRAFAEVVADLPASERPTLGYLACAGGPLPVSLAGRLRETFPDAELWSQYGLTEASPRVTALSANDPRFFQGAAGFPLSGIRVSIEQGELVVHTPSAMLEYLDEPDATRARLRGGLRTGDRARIDADGCVWITGRADDLVKIQGERVSLATVESAVESAVGLPLWVGAAEHHGEIELHCVVECATLDRDRWRRAVVGLPIPMRPRHWLALPKLPRLPSGKVDRAALARWITTAEAKSWNG